MDLNKVNLIISIKTGNNQITGGALRLQTGRSATGIEKIAGLRKIADRKLLRDNNPAVTGTVITTRDKKEISCNWLFVCVWERDEKGCECDMSRPSSIWW